jgi:hypothetical protein
MKTSFFNLHTLTLVLVVSSITFSCKKDDVEPEPTDTVGIVEFDFEHVFGGTPLDFGVDYTNAAGEIMNFSMFKYFVSNIELVKEDNSVYTVPKNQSFFLVDHSNVDSWLIRLPNIPTGTYTAVRFILGIDSLTNTLPIEERTGTLDVAGIAQGMYWTWNSGYIFLKVEGNSPASPEDEGFFKYHIGGFGGFSSPTISNVKTLELSREGGAPFTVQSGRVRGIHIVADLKMMFEGSTQVSVAAHPIVMFNPYSVNLANNYAEMFRLDHIH